MILKKRLGVVFAVVFVDFLGLSFILPLYPELSSRFGLSAFEITLLAALYALMQFIFSPVFGRLSDRLGRKPVLLLSSLGTAISFLFFGLAKSVLVLFVARIINGIFGASVAVAQAYIADTTEHEERTEGMGIVGAALGLGLILGPAISGFLGKFGFGAPAFGAAIVTLTNFFLIAFFLEESLKKEFRTKRKLTLRHFNLERFKDIVKHPFVGRVIATYFLAMFALAEMQHIAILFAESRFHLTVAESGLFFAFIGVVLILVQGFLVGRAEKFLGESRIVLLGILFMTVGSFLIPTAERIWTITLFAGLVVLGAGLYLPAINSLVSKNSSHREQGEIFGITQSLIGIALILGPIIGGFLFDFLGSGSPFFLAGIFTLLSFYYAWKVFKILKVSNREF